MREEEQINLKLYKHEEDKILLSIVTLDEEKKDALQTFSSISEGQTLTCQEIWYNRQVLDVIDRNIHKETIVLSTVRKKITDTETRLIERHREVKIIDKHVENLTAASNKTERLLEQEEIDDVVTIRFEPKEEQ